MTPVANRGIVILVGEDHQRRDAVFVPAAQQAVAVGDRDAQQGAVEAEASAP